MLNISNLGVGVTFKYNGDPYQVVKASHLKMGRGSAVLQTKIKNLKTGKTLEKNFKQSDKFDEADISKKKADYLYQDGEQCYFMDEDYEQFFLGADLIKDQLRFMKESVNVEILFFDGNAIGVELPVKIDLKVIEAPPAVRGDTAQGSVTKVIKLETGAEINAPIFIKENDVIKINTETGEYVERVNS